MNVRTKNEYDWDGIQLRRWRMKHGVDQLAACKLLGVSTPTLYRIEGGYVPPIHLANKIVNITRGAIRYRDIYRSFRPEYA
jgi:DNA-binding XRE family transcriptional regulator